jgi:hypothetical protein
MKQTYTYEQQAFSFDLRTTGKIHHATLGTQTVTVELIRAEGGRLDMLIDGRPVSANVSLDGAKRWVRPCC